MTSTITALRSAATPPEERGHGRNDVKLIVAGPSIEHTRFDRFADFLEPGDVLVVNTSPTMPAAIDGVHRGRLVVVHVSMPIGNNEWIVELRRPDQHGPLLDADAGDAVGLADGGVTLRLARPADATPLDVGTRLWRTDPVEADLEQMLRRQGRPIRYDYVPEPWPLDRYQTIFSHHGGGFGSAEMASAARPFTIHEVTELIRNGVQIVPIVLHAGVGSLETHETPGRERFEVPPATVEAINTARRAGHRMIAVGTTATRALESAVNRAGVLEPRLGWTDLVLGPDTPTRVVDGILTGWHPPEASHLALLQAVVGRELVDDAYAAAAGHDYLLHEFGDACLLLR